MNNKKQIVSINKKIKELQAEVDLLSKADVFDRWDLVPIDTPVILGEDGRKYFYHAGDGRAFGDQRTKRGHLCISRNECIELDTEADNIYAYKPWFGGLRPVNGNTIVKTIWSDGTIVTDRAEMMSWEHEDNGDDLVLYSVIK